MGRPFGFECAGTVIPAQSNLIFVMVYLCEGWKYEVDRPLGRRRSCDCSKMRDASKWRNQMGGKYGSSYSRSHGGFSRHMRSNPNAPLITKISE